jgi:molybdopterin/thiamine biosynthesis adenylyltransferase
MATRELQGMADGGEGRDLLRRSHVLIVGAGALGSPAALCLAAAGVGTLTLVDPDEVEISNLQRQILHRTNDVGRAKVDSAAARIRGLHPEVVVQGHVARVDVANLRRFFADADFVIDATDGVESKFLINDGAVLTARPYSHAGVIGFTGQTMTVLPGRTTCYRCLFPEAPPPGAVPTCQEAGIIGGVAGVIGSLQAGEAIKFLSGRGQLLTDALLTYDALSGRCRRIQLARNPRCPLCGEQPIISSLDAARAARYGS